MELNKGDYMKKTEDLIKTTDLWAGLNKPGIEIKDADIVVFGQAFDKAASVRKGAKDGPRAIRAITDSITPTTEDFEVIDDINLLDLGDFSGEQLELFEEVEELVREIVREKKFFTMLGGDHSVTIPVYNALDKELEGSLGVIHIDAHFDLNDELAGSRLSHGCPARRATELEIMGGVEPFYFVGIRSIEMGEVEFLKREDVNIISARDFQVNGYEKASEKVINHMKKYDNVYISLDIDCLDPAFAAGTGTPQFGGLYSRELLEFLRNVFELNIIGFDVVEVAPSLDESLTSVYAARKIITECWAHHLRKQGRVK